MSAHEWPTHKPPKGWRVWVDWLGTVHHIGTDGWCWEHSGDGPVYCEKMGHPRSEVAT